MLAGHELKYVVLRLSMMVYQQPMPVRMLLALCFISQALVVYQ
jgi:hypothetical protein